MLERLDHPNIIRYVESFEATACLHIVTEFASRGDLHSLIEKRRGKRFKEVEALDLFVQICLALKYLHELHILHRDIKTSNIFLTSQNVIKVGDFGIAKVLAHTMQCARTAVGTPYYMSPEICQERPYNNRSDVWALGCVLYELATLKHAFEANSIKALVAEILRGRYRPLPPEYSRDLRDLVSAMLTRDPSRRPSVGAVLQQQFIRARIAAFLQGKATTCAPDQVPTPVPPTPLPPPPQPAPAPAPAAAGGLLDDWRDVRRERELEARRHHAPDNAVARAQARVRQQGLRLRQDAERAHREREERRRARVAAEVQRRLREAERRNVSPQRRRVTPPPRTPPQVQPSYLRRAASPTPQRATPPRQRHAVTPPIAARQVGTPVSPVPSYQGGRSPVAPAVQAVADAAVLAGGAEARRVARDAAVLDRNLRQLHDLEQRESRLAARAAMHGGANVAAALGGAQPPPPASDRPTPCGRRRFAPPPSRTPPRRTPEHVPKPAPRLPPIEAQTPVGSSPDAASARQRDFRLRSLRSREPSSSPTPVAQGAAGGVCVPVARAGGRWNRGGVVHEHVPGARQVVAEFGSDGQIVSTVVDWRNDEQPVQRQPLPPLPRLQGDYEAEFSHPRVVQPQQDLISSMRDALQARPEQETIISDPHPKEIAVRGPTATPVVSSPLRGPAGGRAAEFLQVGSGADGGLSSRVELLRLHLEEQLGIAKLVQAHRVLKEGCGGEGRQRCGDDAVDRARAVVGGRGEAFVPLIVQLILCEDALNDANTS
eukprot:TRINITY_DN1710_c6_g1_i1.p1 TRINITY_DN1710_c6_g1~~TRINITY_DN1710_c6_g1_i1.p1  ORF type:complete len:888 (+),score=168.68 TRINITY_DN1710_c6_g1_i1:349-2664(+)